VSGSLVVLPLIVMRGHSRSKNGVLSHAYDKPDHDKGEAVTPDRRIKKVIGES
jgi:hypothetical protein